MPGEGLRRGSRQTANNHKRPTHNEGWNLTEEQVARLDAASATPLAYPYWHQRGFAERNPPPV